MNDKKHDNDAKQVVVISGNERLQKHIQTLSALTEIESLSTQNTEDAVSDFDDRLKRAEGKVKVIQSILGESPSAPGSSDAQQQITKRTQRAADGNMEDFAVPKARARS